MRRLYWFIPALALLLFPGSPAYGQIPAPPAHLTVAPGPSGGAILHWDTSVTAMSYKLYKSADGSPFFVFAMTSHTSFFDWAVEPGHHYRYFVRAFNMSGGSGPSDTVRFGLLPPPPPPVHGVARGHVSDDSSGLPLSYATIRLFNLRSLWAVQTHADSAGDYRVPVDTGRYLIRAEKFGYIPEWFQNADRPSEATVVEVHQDSVTVDFGLTHVPPPPPPVAVSGMVRDSLTGEPLRNAFVALLRPHRVFRELQRMLGIFGGLFHEHIDLPGFGRLDGVVWAGLTDSNGAYEAHILPGQRYIALAFKPGYVHKFYKDKLTPFDADRIEVTGDSAGFDFDLIQNPFAVNTLSGSVHDSTGLGIPSHVVLIRLTAFGPLPVRWSVTDSLGNYAFFSLVAGNFKVKAVPLDGYAPAWHAGTACGVRRFGDAETVTVAGNLSDIDVCVVPMNADGVARIAGQVNLGGQTMASEASASPETQSVTVYAVSASSGAVAGYDITEGDGSYAIDHLPPGSYTIVADKEGFASSPVPVTVDETNAYEQANTPVTVTPESPTAAAGGPSLPGRFSLAQNYPNPFNPATRISFELPVASTVAVRVYSVIGQLVAELVHGAMDAGIHDVTWNGTDGSGRPMGTGVYFIKMEATPPGGATFTQVRKAMLMK